jgi:hypothetical protein
VVCDFEKRGNYSCAHPPWYVWTLFPPPKLLSGQELVESYLTFFSYPQVADDDVMCCTGWVPGTDIGGSISEWVEANAPDLERVTVEESAVNCMKVLNGLRAEDAGAYFNHDGTAIAF